MLFTSLYVGLLLLYWTGAWTSRTKVLWFYSGLVGISVGANIIRNTLLAYFHGTGQDQAFHWLHDSWGGDLYSTVMLGLIALLLQGIDRWIVPQDWVDQLADPDLSSDLLPDALADSLPDLGLEGPQLGTEPDR
ncbi:MAG: archaeosortase/exosortase family protein, partial [Elainella sp.]